MRSPTDLRPYQRRGALLAYRKRALAVMVDMSLGKTVIALSAIRGLIKARKRRAALVVVPLRVLETETWQKEAAQWSHTKHLKFSVVYGNPRKRLTALEVPADIYITNYENLKWLAEIAGTPNRPLRSFPFDILVLDESTFVKNASSRRFTAIRNRLFRFFKSRYVLTGTPMPNSLLEFWSQIYVLDDGARLGTSHERFKTRFFEQQDYQGYKWEPRDGAVPYVMRLISDITLRLDANDWIKLPKIVSNIVPVVLPPAVRALYDRHEREMFTELRGGRVFEAVTAATLSMQCHQIANGAIYVEDENLENVVMRHGQHRNPDLWNALHDAKLKALAELIQEHPGQQIMVAYWFKHDLARLRTRWPKARIMERGNAKQIEEDWAKHKIPLLFVQPRGSSHGLNELQHGGHIIVWFSLTWSGELYYQLIHRLRRPQNSSDRILVHHLVAQDTVDEVILETNQTKDRNQRTALNLLRAYASRRGMVP